MGERLYAVRKATCRVHSRDDEYDNPYSPSGIGFVFGGLMAAVVLKHLYSYFTGAAVDWAVVAMFVTGLLWFLYDVGRFIGNRRYHYRNVRITLAE